MTDYTREQTESDIRQSTLTMELQKTIMAVDEQFNDALTGGEIMLTLLKMVTGYQQRLVTEECLAASGQTPDGVTAVDSATSY